jgi:hypothetical protein
LSTRKCRHTLSIGRDEKRTPPSLKAGGRDAALIEMTACTSPITADRADGLFHLLNGRGRQSDASRTAVSGCEYSDSPTLPNLVQRREQIADNERVTKSHVRYDRPDAEVARGVQSFKLMQVSFLIDRWRICNPQPGEAERFSTLSHATRLSYMTRE